MPDRRLILSLYAIDPRRKRGGAEPTLGDALEQFLGRLTHRVVTAVEVLLRRLSSPAKPAPAGKGATLETGRCSRTRS
jgi:hypothetical protein